MKRLICIVFILLFNSIQSQNSEIENVKFTINKDLSEWTKSFKNFNWNDFIKVDSIAVFENFEKQSFKHLKKFQSVYNPIISYSKNKDKFIDIYSSQLNLEKKNDKYYSTIDIGQAIYLCDIKNKYWARIFYGEYSRKIDDIVWINENDFLLVGTEKNENDKNSPVIYIGNLKNKSLEIVINTDKNCFQKEETYKSEKLKSIKIED